MVFIRAMTQIKLTIKLHIKIQKKVEAEIQPSLHCTVKVSTSSDEGDGETIKIDWDESSSD